MRILIVEDDSIISSSIFDSLKRWGYEPHCVTRFDDVMGEVARVSPHLIIMDISLPYFNGYYWCEKIRANSKMPILFLSSHQEPMDLVMAINLGADDYLQKPVPMDVLLAKISALLRRAYNYETVTEMKIGDAALDSGASCLVRGDRRIPLTRNEVRMLDLLLSRKGRLVSREQLMLKLWDDDTFVDDNTLTVNINRLRKKLDEEGLDGCIITHKGQGYSINA
ncbi:MAG: response regulator transcription factor [Eubacteriales bacterium]|nr:response regulator transcription factor [Eubacteriales bacterium]